MSFVHQHDHKASPGAAIGVIAIHAAVGLALVKGLTFAGIIQTDDNMDTVFVTADPPKKVDPVVDPQPQKDPTPSQQYAPDPMIELTPTGPVVPDVEIADAVPFVNPIILPAPKPLPVAAALDPIPAKPSNNSAKWVTTADYPARDLRSGNEGTTGFRLIIGSDGKVRNCEITQSSGSESLDRAACKNVSSRARFDPARNENGDDIVGEYTSSVRWQIPD